MSHSVAKEEKYTLVTIETQKLDTTVAPGLKTDLVVLKSEGVKNIIIDLFPGVERPEQSYGNLQSAIEE